MSSPEITVEQPTSLYERYSQQEVTVFGITGTIENLSAMCPIDLEAVSDDVKERFTARVLNEAGIKIPEEYGHLLDKEQEKPTSDEPIHEEAPKEVVSQVPEPNVVKPISVAGLEHIQSAQKTEDSEPVLKVTKNDEPHMTKSEIIEKVSEYFDEAVAESSVEEHKTSELVAVHEVITEKPEASPAEPLDTVRSLREADEPILIHARSPEPERTESNVDQTYVAEVLVQPDKQVDQTEELITDFFEPPVETPPEKITTTILTELFEESEVAGDEIVESVENFLTILPEEVQVKLAESIVEADEEVLEVTRNLLVEIASTADQLHELSMTDQLESEEAIEIIEALKEQYTELLQVLNIEVNEKVLASLIEAICSKEYKAADIKSDESFEDIFKEHRLDLDALPKFSDLVKALEMEVARLMVRRSTAAA